MSGLDPSVAFGAAFLSILLFAWVIAGRPREGEAAKLLSRGLRLYSKAAGRTREDQSTLSSSSPIARRAAELVDRLPHSKRAEQQLQHLLDRSGWPLRSSEFVAIQAFGAFAGALVGGALLGRWLLAGVLAVGAAFLPRVLLNRRIAARKALVMAQLPDTLQLLAGSLQAGYGFMQAIDTLVREAPQPTASEFSRVLTETRLGMPVEDALTSMAERLGSDDFRWVVLAINIQRQVGGNLSALLGTVANTLREREAVRRQIKVLSAEGKLSAYILGALPFAIAGYIAMVNPSFLATLTGEPIGRVMIAGALVMLGVGIVWMRKIIRIEV